MPKEKILIKKLKIQRLWVEQGKKNFLKKMVQFFFKKIFPASNKKTLRKCQALFQIAKSQELIDDIELLFHKGLFRALSDIKSDLRIIGSKFEELLIIEADRIMANQFVLYGMLSVSPNFKFLSWRTDPISGYTWPDNLTRGYFVNHKPVGTDIKNLWEIARFQFLSSLAYAYILTNKKRYAYFAIDKIRSWIEENPFLKGPHWTLPMESSIRLINWCMYLPLLDVFKYTDSLFKEKIMQSMIEHLVFIRENLEVSITKEGNHYLSNLVGLLLAKLLFPSIKWAKESSEFATKEIKNEIDKQFDVTGLYFEGSTAYHRLCSEMSLIGSALIKMNRGKLSSKLVERLLKVSEFSQFYNSICDVPPIIGDNDSGIFIKLFPGQELNHHGYIKALSDSILKNASEPHNFSEFFSSVHFTNTYLLDDHNRRVLNSYEAIKLHVKKFDGLIVASYGSEAIFFNTLNSLERHSHNDKLSIYPVIGRRSIFLDRGSFSYTGFPRKRQKDRMSSSHNGPVVNNWEQSSIWKEDLFYINGEAKCFNSVNQNGDNIKITGNHIGYDRFRKGLKTYRQIEWDLNERIILIEDWLEGKPTHETFQLTWNFLINPVWISSLSGNCFKFTCQNLQVYFEDLQGVNFKIIQSHYCPAYQIEKKCLALNASEKIRIGEKIRFRIRY